MEYKKVYTTHSLEIKNGANLYFCAAAATEERRGSPHCPSVTILIVEQVVKICYDL